MGRNDMENLKYLREEVIEYLQSNIPVVLDIEKNDFKFDKNHIYYKIYKYIKELEKSDKNE